MSGEYCIDANVLITAWNDLYPVDIFPSLWRELAVHKASMTLIKPIYDEIDPISQSDEDLSDRKKKEKYPLRTWLIGSRFAVTLTDEQIEAKSLLLRAEYKIDDDTKGADLNDLTLIAYAKKTEKIVVTFEARQDPPPAKKSKYKIPLICDQQDVECIAFIEMLRRLHIKI